jgi:hypothetical protein
MTTLNARRFLIFLSSMVLTSVAFQEGTAGAWWRRQSGYTCMVDTYAGNNSTSVGRNLSNAGPSNSSTSNYAFLRCPLNDDSTGSNSGIVTLNVEVVDNSTTDVVFADACVQYWNSAGGTCGTTKQTTAAGTGHFTLNPTLAWSSFPSDLGYVEVILPPFTGSSTSMLTGIYTST